MRRQMHFKTVVALLIAILSATVVTSAEPFFKSVTAASWVVTISNFAFHPQNATGQVRDTVTWMNNDPVVHTLWFTKANDGSTYLFSDPINPGATWVHTFPDIMQLKYYSFRMLWINGSLGILPSFHFSMSNSGDVNLYPNGVGSNRILLTLFGGQARPVSLSCSGLPTGVQCYSFYPSTGVPPFNSTLLITYTNSTPAGVHSPYPISVIGTGGGAINSTTFNLIIPSGTVGGATIPVDKLALAAPYLFLSLAVAVISTLVAFARLTDGARRRKGRKNPP